MSLIVLALAASRASPPSPVMQWREKVIRRNSAQWANPRATPWWVAMDAGADGKPLCRPVMSLKGVPGALPRMGAPNAGMATSQLFANLTISDTPPGPLPQPPAAAGCPPAVASKAAHCHDALAALGLARK